MDHLSVAPEKPVQLEQLPSLQPGDQVRLVSDDDLRRERVTVFFRFFMALPHLVWLSLWGAAMVTLAPAVWVVALVTRRPPQAIMDVYDNFVRYSTHVYAFWLLAAEPFPGFLGRARSYPVDLEVAPVAEQGRWSIGLRLLLALPPVLLAGALLQGGGVSTGGGVALLAAFGAWWAFMATARMPPGLRDLILWALGYAAQTFAYLFLLTGRYPNSDPAVAPVAPVPEHPVRLELTDELRRDRWLVAFRYVLAMPHFAWQGLWTLLAVPAAIAGWFAALALGRLPARLHRFLARYVRYWAHVNAFFYLGGGLFPGFAGREGSYPVDVVIAPPERQSRWTIAFRLILALPPLALASAVFGVAVLAGIGGWFAALFTGRMPQGLRNVVAFGVRYSAQSFAYVVLLTPRYPYSGPGDFRR
ncbi:MAG TPA: DUF4389 domain-containing protein [Solirubrobacteraceae bacterium]|nr:DUF4389 domain-containing protein [Solirubrobacteraceae bacterium]